MKNLPYNPTDMAELEDPFDVAVSLVERETLAMVEDALRAGRVVLAYQPVVLARRPEQVAFWEGLLRVLDRSGRVIPARDFLPYAERHELGRLLDCKALELGLEVLAWEPTVRLSINMSARSIGYPGWMQTLERGLARDETIAERLILEITEDSAMLMPDIVAPFTDDLHRRGVAFALDDFGAGYTAIRYFKEFLFDVLKIDVGFIRGIERDPDNQTLVRALLSIGRHFEMFTVAEGVETAEEAAFLVNAGVDCLQGYHCGMPTVRPPWVEQARVTV